MDIAIIGGSGVYDPKMLDDLRTEVVGTPYGDVELVAGRFGGREVGFLARHGVGHAVPPHRVNYRANIWALKSRGVRRIIATAAVGSCNPKMVPGDFVLVSDFIDFTRQRPCTFFEGGPQGVVHTDFTEPYCPVIRRVLVQAAGELGIPRHDGGVYVCTEGPRFETPAEIRMFARLGGDLVGMTNVPEVVLAHEVGICYGLVAMVTNAAAGIAASHLSHAEVLEIMAQNGENLRRLAMRALELMPAPPAGLAVEPPAEPAAAAPPACRCGPGTPPPKHFA